METKPKVEAKHVEMALEQMKRNQYEAIHGDKCIGILGWLSGHKYIPRYEDEKYVYDVCQRCGKRILR